MQTRLSDVYMFVFDEYLVNTQYVADSWFDGDVDNALAVLQTLGDEHEVIKMVGDDSWKATPDPDNIERSEAEAIAQELPNNVVYDTEDQPETAESAPQVQQEASPESPEPIQETPEEAKLARARQNFADLVESCPSEAGKAFWQAKLAELTPA